MRKACLVQAEEQVLAIFADSFGSFAYVERPNHVNPGSGAV
jgi:hypothetical protein